MKKLSLLTIAFLMTTISLAADKGQDLLEIIDFEKEDPKKAEQLIKDGAPVNYQDPESGETPLMAAAKAGSAYLTELLLKKGADVKAMDHMGRNALFMAAWGTDKLGSREAIAKMLIAKGIAVETQGRSKQTALMGAAKAGNKSLVELLLEKGANPHAKESRGETALSFAKKGNYREVVEVLEKAEKGTMLESKN